MATDTISIRQLVHDYDESSNLLQSNQDWKLWKSLRIEGAQLNPDAFDHTLEELHAFDDSYYQRILFENVVFAAFEGNEIIGGLGFAPGKIKKQKHRGEIFNVFLKPKCRGKGVGKLLFNHVINFVRKERQEILQLHLSVGTLNGPAVGLYQSMGFQIYATEEKRLRATDGVGFIDEYLMILRMNS